MQKRRIWYRAFDGWFYGQVSKGRRRRQKRILRGPNTPTRCRKAQRRYNHIIKADPGQLTELSATDRLKAIFLAFLKIHSKRHCSLETHRWYRHFLKSFARKFGALRFCHLTPDGKKKWGETTRNRAITCVKVAINWFIRRKKLKENPLQDLEKPPMGRRERLVSPSDRKVILGAVRDKAFKLFLFAVSSTGARPGEVRKVEAKHFHLSGLWLFPPKEHKTGKKTRKPRVVYLTPPMIKLCVRLARERPDGPLFVNSRGKPWTSNAVRIRFRNLRKKFPQLNGVVCYCWRHTYTTDALERGVPIATVAELLGHSSARMVQEHYSHLSQKTAHLQAAATTATRPRREGAA